MKLRDLRDIDWARLNHILLPTPRRGSTELAPKNRRAARVFFLLFDIYRSFTPLGQFVFVAVLVAAVFSLDIAHSRAYVIFSALAGALYASLAVSRRFRIPGLEVKVASPARIHVGDEMTFDVSCRLAPDARAPRGPVRVTGPFLPYFGKWTAPPTYLDGIPAGEARTLTAKARFTRRGDFVIGRFGASALVPFGLASGPFVDSERVRVRIVPRPANVAQLTLPLSTRHQPGGVALASRTGESMDLLGVRPYRSGDRVRDLHARTWARTRIPAVREYQEEYFTRLGVVVDCHFHGGSRRAKFASERRFEGALSLAAGVVAHMTRGEALIDLLVVGGQLHRLTLGRSLGFLDQALDLLAGAEYDAVPDRAKVERELFAHVARLSAVVVVTDEAGDRSERLATTIERRGTRVVRLVIDGVRPTSRGVVNVPLSAIEGREALSL